MAGSTAVSNNVLALRACGFDVELKYGCTHERRKVKVRTAETEESGAEKTRNRLTMMRIRLCTTLNIPHWR